MLQEKRWWASRGVIGGLVATIGVAVGWSVAETTEWTNILIDLVSVAGGLLAVYGRVMATREIALVK